MKRPWEETQQPQPQPHTILIVGAGFGGLSTALRLLQHKQSPQSSGSSISRSSSSDTTPPSQLHRIVLLDAGDTFTIGGLWQFVWTGRIPHLRHVTFDLRLAEAQLQAQASKAATTTTVLETQWNTRVVQWDPVARHVVVVKHDEASPSGNLKEEEEEDETTTTPKPNEETTIITYDTIVWATGAVTNPGRIPGMSNYINICTYGMVERQRQQLQTFLDKVQNAIGSNSYETTTASTTKAAAAPPPLFIFCLAVSQCPYKCPVAPFEVVCLVDAALRQRRVREACRIVLTCPVAWPMPVASRPAFEKILAQRNIEYHGNWTVARVEPRDDEPCPAAVVYYQEAGIAPLTVDLLWTMYPIEAPAVIRQAMPAQHVQDGFVNIEKNHRCTHRIPGLDAVYAIGDCCRVAVTDDYIMPKAGEFAWKMGRSVADDILRVTHPTTDRTGECIAELGLGQGIVVQNDFSAMMTLPSLDDDDDVAAFHRMQVDVVDDCDAKKMDWVNSYVRQIFGEEYCLSLSRLGLLDQKVDAPTTTTDEEKKPNGRNAVKDSVDDKVVT
eukprot:scaffold970_cov187-Amphora_coffeaeformis.AAC.6